VYLLINHPRVLELTLIHELPGSCHFQHGLTEGTACGLEVQTSTGETDLFSSQSYRRGKNFPKRS